MKNCWIKVILPLCLISTAPLTETLGAKIEDVSFDEKYDLGNTTLRLSGLGLLRYLLVIKVYVGAFKAALLGAS